LLAARWRSREELHTRLRGAGFDDEEISVSLADLERAGLVDDERFALEVTRDQAGRRLAGDRAIRTLLRRRGVSDERVQRALDAAGDESDRAAELARRQALRLSGVEAPAAYRRLVGLLLRRGYAHDVAREAARVALVDAVPETAADLDPDG
jgi:regulatory protein